MRLTSLASLVRFPFTEIKIAKNVQSEKNVKSTVTASDYRTNTRDHLAHQREQADLMDAHLGHSQTL